MGSICILNVIVEMVDNCTALFVVELYVFCW